MCNSGFPEHQITQQQLSDCLQPELDGVLIGITGKNLFTPLFPLKMAAVKERPSHQEVLRTKKVWIKQSALKSLVYNDQTCRAER